MTDAPLQSAAFEPLAAFHEGDDAAQRGDWVRAITLWAQQHERESGPGADQRIRWFLDEVDGPGESRRRNASHRHVGTAILLSAAGVGLLGTALVLLGIGRTGTMSSLISVAAWACYLASGVLIVTFAWHRGQSGSADCVVGDDDVARALAFARALDPHPPATDPAHP